MTPATSSWRTPMQQYLLSIYQPGGPIPPPDVLGPIMKNVEALRNEMKAAGAWVFSGGLFAEGKEYLGGFTIVQAPDLDAALEWGRKLARTLTPPAATSGLAVEV